MMLMLQPHLISDLDRMTLDTGIFEFLCRQRVKEKQGAQW